MYQNKMSVREPLPKCEVNGIVLTMLRFFRLFSLAPLRFTRVRNGVYRITMSRVLFILGTPLPIIINLLTILLYHSILQSERQRFNFAYAFVRVLLLVIVGTPDVLTTTLVILKGHGRMRNLMSILNQIQKIRRKIGYDHSLDPSTLKIILIMAGPFMMHVAMQITGLYIEELKNFISNVEGICLSVIIITCHTIILTMQLQYFFLALLLRLTSETLNKKLTLFTIRGAGGMVVSRCNYKHLRNLYGSYLLIWEVISDLMQTEGLYLVLILYALITRIFVTTYNIWRYYNCLDESTKSVKFFIYEFFWMINHVIDILLLIEPFHRMNREMEYTKIVMSRLLNTMSRNTAFYYELDNFFQQFTLNLQGFTPLGLCHLNRPLIATIVGFLVTFLSITNQFKFYESM